MDFLVAWYHFPPCPEDLTNLYPGIPLITWICFKITQPYDATKNSYIIKHTDGDRECIEDCKTTSSDPFHQTVLSNVVRGEYSSRLAEVMNFSLIYVLLMKSQIAASFQSIQSPTDSLLLPKSSNELIDPPNNEIATSHSPLDLSTEIETSSSSPDNTFLTNVGSGGSDNPLESLAASPEDCGSEDKDLSNSFQFSLIRKSTRSSCPNPNLSDQSSPNPFHEKRPSSDSNDPGHSKDGQNNIVNLGGKPLIVKRPRCPKERQTPACCGLKNIQAIPIGLSVFFNLGICVNCK